MFYAQFVLSKKGPLAKIWLAAHWEKKLTKAQVFETNIDKAVESILEPKVKMALRTTGHLLLGVVRIYSRKAKYLLADCNEAFIKIKMAFRPGAAVDLPEEGREANLNAITLPEVFHDFDSALPDFNDFEYQQQLSLNQSRLDDITMKEDVPTTSYNVQDDEFGGDGFDSLELERENATDLDAGFDRVNLSRPIGDLSKGGAPMPMDIDAPIIDDGFGGQLDDNLLEDGLNLFDDQPFEGFDAGAIGRDIEFENLEENELEKNRKTPKPAAIAAAETAKSVVSETTTGVTTLIQNEEESFALEPLDATAATGVEKRGKRKRRLIVDDVKAISGEDMKGQLNDFTDIISTLDLAPPTKKLMGFKETGGVDKLFSAPGLQFASKQLVKLLLTNVAQRSKKDDVVEPLADGALVLEDIIVETARGAAGAETTDRRFISPIPEDVGGENQQRPSAEVDENMAEEFQNIGGLPSVSPQPTSPWAPNLEEPPSVLPAPASPRKERKSRVPSTPRHDRSAEENEETPEDHGDEEEDRQWTKRTEQIQAVVRNKLKNHDYVTFVDLCARKDNRKIAAQKFYTLLVLKKSRAVDVEQDEPYGEIRIREGPRLHDVLHV